MPWTVDVPGDASVVEGMAGAGSEVCVVTDVATVAVGGSGALTAVGGAGVVVEGLLAPGVEVEVVVEGSLPPGGATGPPGSGARELETGDAG